MRTFSKNVDQLHNKFSCKFYELINEMFLTPTTQSSESHKYPTLFSLFRNKRFALNEMFQRNTSKFAKAFIWEKVRLHEMKNEKNYQGFLMHKI